MATTELVLTSESGKLTAGVPGKDWQLENGQGHAIHEAMLTKNRKGELSIIIRDNACFDAKRV